MADKWLFIIDGAYYGAEMMASTPASHDASSAYLARRRIRRDGRRLGWRSGIEMRLASASVFHAGGQEASMRMTSIGFNIMKYLGARGIEIGL